MPAATFHVAVDAARALVHIRLAGFFTVPDVRAFAATWHVEHDRLRGAPNQHVTLCDLSQMSIQTQDVVAAFTEVVRDPRRQGRLLAMVVGASLARHQAKRLNIPDRPGVAFFYDTAEAETWLFSADRTAARYPHAPVSPRSGGHGCTARSAA
ncbi:hypothetical protein M9979_00175 [Sphingomonas sp. RP10(2022)]|uniref:STAS/SEC14 domain-containing protein n=1 Tax=Sphingomonas liriopis TaxID=2949094 RepID=A0A9X2KNX4_9SPHN|nr:hypothetical protein [Sphingomonas liriopis]MCP3733302.1 hypothetical protein [Sphingomonas liriopis]